ncbi:hypothetical protein GCM10009737_10540 [Nocardioides lentus]|uniref:Uncharacterized protein n=1 Tax=Nocardioides lentus TaxID=338077 RepID=A0ABP5ADE7_9ACTN
MVDREEAYPTAPRGDPEQLSQVTRTGALTGLAGHGVELGRSWADLNISRQHAITTAIIDHVTVGPGTPGARTLDPARVAVTWRH